MQVCPHCHASVPDDILRCSECGTDLDPCRTIPPPLGRQGGAANSPGSVQPVKRPDHTLRPPKPAARPAKASRPQPRPPSPPPVRPLSSPPTPPVTPAPTPTPFFFSPDPGSPGLFSAPPTLAPPTPTPTQPSGPTPAPPDCPTQTPGNPTLTPPPSGPQAAFSYEVAGLTVTFTNKSTGTGLSYLWDFGDGGGNSKTNPKHTYPNKTADYTVVLNVTDSLGRTSSRTKVVHIDEVVATPPPTQKPTDQPPTPGPS